MFLWIKDTMLVMYFYKYPFLDSIICRGLASLLASFFISMCIGGYVIDQLYTTRLFQIIRSSGPKSHELKQGTPTLGGIIILLSVTISIIIWSNLSDFYIRCVLFIFITYGILGLIDDLFKIIRKNTIGLGVVYKYFWQSIIALVLILVFFICQINDIHMTSSELCFKKIIFQLNIWDILLAYLVIVGTSNSVNLSDGLDGLAIILVISILLGLTVITCVSSNIYCSNYLHILYCPKVKELIIVCTTMIGASLGFLWFNTYPARVFMGDTGSLACGGLIGLIAILLHQEFLLLIMGGIFVIESLSVILQVSYFKLFKKRIFRMAPIHHHFELKGYLEPQIIVRFGIISSILVCFSLFVFVT